MPDLLIVLAGWGVEAAFGYPPWVFRWATHPVVWMGAVIEWLTTCLNRPAWPHRLRYGGGVLTTVLLLGVTLLCTLLLEQSLSRLPGGWVIEILVVSSLIASRSLLSHFMDVVYPLAVGDSAAARAAVSKIVGRDPSRLDETGVARASLETLAENASDGVVAPLFWGCILGLPGMAAYKAVNTLDSMIGHRTPQYAAFGGFAARLDDIANFIPARITGLLIALASGHKRSFQVMMRDAGAHRSPNAGWPEAAMAGALGVRLSGPRQYDDRVAPEPWLNAEAPDPTVARMKAGAALYQRALVIWALLLLVLLAYPNLAYPSRLLAGGG